jgi:hypothetical protein
MAGALTVGVLGAIVAHRCPIARDWVPLPAPIYSRPGESCYAIIHPGLFPFPDTSLHLLTIAGAQFLHWIPPQWWLPSCRSSSLPERGSWTAERAHRRMGGESTGLCLRTQGSECRM